MIIFLYVLEHFFKLIYPVTLLILTLNTALTTKWISNTAKLREPCAPSVFSRNTGSLYFEVCVCVWGGVTMLCNCWGGVSRQCVHRSIKYATGRYCGQPAIILCIVTFPDMWKERSCLLSQRGWSGLLGHTHTFLSQISIHFHLSTPHCVLPQGHIMTWACDKEPGSSRRGEGGVGADCQAGRAGFSWSLPLSALSVSFSVLAAAADLSVPRGLCERREMWCCYSDASYGGVCLQWPRCIPPFYNPSTHTRLHLLLFYLSRETPGARRGVTAVSGMLGRQCSHFPGLRLHLRLSDAGTRISYTLGAKAQNKTDNHT